MAIIVENIENEKDQFKVKCQCCGRDLLYSRSDIKPHRRWPNGFIYCPGCKTPIGHNEENIYLRGVEIEKQAVSKLSDDELLSDKKKYTRLSVVFTIVSSTLFFIGIVVFLISLLKTTSCGNAYEEALYGAFIPLPIAAFISGLGLLPLVISCWVKLAKTRDLINKKEKYGKDSN